MMNILRDSWARGFLIMVLGLFLWTGTGSAQQTFTSSLADLAPGARTRLVGISDFVIIKVSVPERWDLDKAVLKLRFTHSTSLLPDQSQVVALVDGEPVAQARLDSASGSGEMEAEIPLNLLAAGYHDLRIEVAQRSTPGCQDPVSPELWTLLDFEQSSLTVEHGLHAVPASLERALAMLFDPKQPQGADLLVVTDASSPEQLKALAVAVAAAAARMEYRPLRVHLGRMVDRSRDCLVVGETEFVDRTLAAAGLEAPPGNLAVIAKEAGQEPSRDAGHGLLLVTGQDSEELLLAAQGLALARPLPDAAYMTVNQVTVPAVTRYSGKGMLEPGQEYAFEDLGFATHTFSGLRPLPEFLIIRLPSDIQFLENQEIGMALDISYGSGMREDSVINLLVNDAYAAAVGVGGDRGGRYSSYTVLLPGSLFKPGTNVIGLHPAFAPLEGGACEYLQTDNLVVTLHQDSRLTMPEASHWTAMPRMELFFQDGFPLADMPDWSGTCVLLADDSMETLTAALNLVALICQANGYPPQDIRFIQDPAEAQGSDILLLGPREVLPDVLIQGSLLMQEQSELEAYGLVRWDLSGIQGPAWYMPRGLVALAEYRSPLDSDRTVLVLTAADAATLQQGAQLLWDPGVRGGLSGALASFALDAPSESLRVLKQETYYLGSVGGVDPVDRFIQANPLLSLVPLLAAGLVLAWGFYRLLKSRKHRHGAAGKSPGHGR